MKVNLASGQRPYPKPWVNVDIRDQGYQIDIEADIQDLPESINDCEVMVAHHVVEHFDMSTVSDTFKHWNEKLVQGGRLLVCVPDAKALTEAWISGRIDDYIYNVNMYGAFQGHPGDLHRWSYTEQSLSKAASEHIKWGSARRLLTTSELDPILYAESEVAFDWWILVMEFQK